MPVSPPSACRTPGCPETVPGHLAKEQRGFCAKCWPGESAKYRRGVSAKRRGRGDTRRYRERMDDEQAARERWYSKAVWRKARNAWIARNPLCALCLEEGRVTPADVVDHIEERKDNDARRLDHSNLQSLCHWHHNRKTLSEKFRRSR